MVYNLKEQTWVSKSGDDNRKRIACVYLAYTSKNAEKPTI
jgi:hypothetical protein